MSQDDRVDFAQLPRPLKDAIKKDAKRHNKSLDSIAEFLVKKWLDLPAAMRAKELEKVPNKIFGRPTV